MATYYRPNLTGDQRDLLLALVREQLAPLSIEHPQFDALYRLHVRLTDCKAISTSRREVE